MKTTNSKLNISVDLTEFLDPKLKDKKPTVSFSAQAYLKMKRLVASTKEEIAWHGTVTKVDSNYVIEDIFVYPQEVTGVTVTTDQEEYSMWLMEQPDEIFNNLRMQGHSHVNMATSPSGVDENLYEQILAQLKDNDYYIFLITNKSGDVNIWIHDMAQNVIWEKEDITLKILLPDAGNLDTWVANVKKENIKTYQKLTPLNDDYPDYRSYNNPYHNNISGKNCLNCAHNNTHYNKTPCKGCYGQRNWEPDLKSKNKSKTYKPKGRGGKH